MNCQFGVAVVLLNWNAAEQTCDCIDQLRKVKNIPIRILVVDNNSSDESVSLIREQYPDVDLIGNKENLGFAGGNNTAFREILFLNKKNLHRQEIIYRFVLLLNTDAGINEESLQVLITTLEESDEVGVAGPIFVNINNTNEVLTAGGMDPSLHINTYRTAKQAREDLAKRKPFPVDYVSGTVALIRVSAIEKCGLFEEKYFFSCEMADLCFRMKQHGFSCLISPSAKAWHEMAMAGNNRETLYLYYILRNRFLFIQRCKSKFIVLLYLRWILICCLYFVRTLLRGKLQTARAIIFALRDGLTGKYGSRNELFIEKADNAKKK